MTTIITITIRTTTIQWAARSLPGKLDGEKLVARAVGGPVRQPWLKTQRRLANDDLGLYPPTSCDL